MTRRYPFDVTPSAAAALALLFGLMLSHALPVEQSLAAVALLGASLALGAHCGTLLALATVGLLIGWQGASSAQVVSPTRPVTVEIERLGGWRSDGDRWSGLARVERLRQGGASAATPSVNERLVVSLPAATRTPARRLRVRGYLRAPASLANGAPQRPARRRLSTGSARMVTVQGEPAPVGGWLAAGRNAVRGAIDRAGLSRSGLGLVQALVLGDTTALGPDRVRALRRVGLAHVVALSGLHLGILAAWCAVVGRFLPGRWVLLWVLVGTGGYLVLAGARPSLVRAWCMVAAVGAATLARRPARPLHALLWTAALMAALSPSALKDLSFQLTFVATFGILVAHRLLRRTSASPESPRLASAPLATAAGAQLATAAVALPAFHWLPSWSWAWNLALVPLVALAAPLCFAWVGLACFAPAIAAATAPVLDLLALPLELPSKVPPAWFGGVVWPPGRLAWGVAVLIVLLLRRHRVAALGVIALLAGATVAPDAEQHEARVHFLDVGQGDATVLVEGGAALLVDGGGWRGPGIAERALLPALARLGVRKLEVAIVSHGDRDHCAGVVELAGYIDIGEVWLSSAAAASDCGRQLLATPWLEVRPLWRGRSHSWRRWSLEVLAPAPGERADGNDSSLVLAARSRGRSVLLTGDLGGEAERRLLQTTSAERLRADVLKVGHHGSASSSSLRLLRTVAPDFAAISCGRGNPFGHPAPRLLMRLRQQGIRHLDTAGSGRIDVRWRRGGGLRVATPAAPK